MKEEGPVVLPSCQNGHVNSNLEGAVIAADLGGDATQLQPVVGSGGGSSSKGTTIFVSRGPPAHRLPPELLEWVASYLQADELMTFETVCKRWREITVMHTSLWMRHLGLLWESTGYSANVPPLVPLTVRIKSSFTVAQMRRSLLLFDTTALVEKTDWVLLLASRLLFGKQLSSTSSPHGYTVPAWCRSVNDGKRALVFGRRETRRLLPLDSELIGYSWSLTYKSNPGHGTFKVCFYVNHEMSCESHGEQRFSWRLLVAGAGTPSAQGVLQVENFPQHRLYRSADGLWCWENDHVLCVQVPPKLQPGEEAPGPPML